MVTFVCENCDTTLKKNQVERHIRGCSGYPRLSCIDCSKVFQGNDHKGHISCISEFEKHHGQYYKPKEKKVKTDEPQNQAPKEPEITKPVIAEKKQEPAPAPLKKEEKQTADTTEASWRGWKTTIRKTLKGKDQFSMKLKILKKNVIKQYLNHHPDVNQVDAEAIFEEKIKNKKFQVDEKQNSISYVPRNKRS